MAYKQYILPLQARADGLYETRINPQSYQPRLYDRVTHLPAKNRDFYQSDQSQVCYVADNVHLKDGVGDFERNVSVDGQLTPGIRSFTFADRLTYSGHDGNGGAVSVASPTGGSLFEEVLNDRTAVHTIFQSKVVGLDVPVNYNSGTAYTSTSLVYHHGDWWHLGNDAPATLTGVEPGGASGYHEDTTTWVRSRELYFIGDIKGDKVTADEYSVVQWVEHLAGYKQERILRTVKFEADDAAIRLSSHVIQDMFEYISIADMNTAAALPAYGGIVNLEGSTYLDGSKTAIPAGILWADQVTAVAKCIPAGVSINDGVHFIPASTLLKKVATTCDFEHTTATDLSTGMQFWIDKIQTIASDGSAHPWIVSTNVPSERTPLAFELTSTNINSSTYYSGASIFDALHLPYEWVVGSNPLCDLHVQKMTSDVSYDWDAPLSEIAAGFGAEFVQRVSIDINQGTKKPILRLLNRRDTGGDSIPLSLKLGKDTKQEQTNVSAQHVEVSNRGFGDKVACPNTKGKSPITKEIPWQAKLRGRSGSLNGNDAVYNASLSPDQQYSCWRTFAGGIAKGGHVVANDATVTFCFTTDTYSVYKIESPSINAWDLTAGNNIGEGGDIVGFLAKSMRVSGLNTTDYGLAARTRNLFYVCSYSGETMPTGTSKSFAAGYDIIGDDGTIDTDDATDFHSTGRSFIPYVGRTLYIPARGIFKILSATDVAGVYHCTVDAPLGKAGSSLAFRLGTAAQNVGINPDGYVAGSMFYVYEPSTTAGYNLTGTGDLLNGMESVDYIRVGSLVHPPYDTKTYSKGTTDRDFSGMYAVSRCCYGLPVPGTPDTPPDYTFGNTIAGPAQVWAAETVGTFSAKRRPYQWNLAPYSGLISNIKLLGTISLTENGTNKNYYATGVKFNELKRPGPEIVYTLTEQPADPGATLDIKTYPVIKIGTGGGSGNANSVGGSGGGGSAGTPGGGGPVDLGNALITKPNSVHRNRAQATAAGVAALETQRSSSISTDDHFTAYLEDGITKQFYVDKDGAQHIELQADVVGSTVQMASGQTNHAQTWKNSGGTILALVDAAGTVYGQNLQSAALTAGNVVADGTGTLVNGAIDLSTVTGTLPVVHGGTGAVTLTGPLHGNGTSPVTGGAIDLSGSDVTNTLPVTNGGTGGVSWPVYGIPLTNGTGAWGAASAGSNGDVLSVVGGVPGFHPPATSGTVTSVGLSAPSSILAVSGSPVTSSGTLTLTLQTQAKNKVWAGPTTGADAAPTFRALVSADVPAVSSYAIGYGDGSAVEAGSILVGSSAHQFEKGFVTAGNGMSTTLSSPGVGGNIIVSSKTLYGTAVLVPTPGGATVTVTGIGTGYPNVSRQTIGGTAGTLTVNFTGGNMVITSTSATESSSVWYTVFIP